MSLYVRFAAPTKSPTEKPNDIVKDGDEAWSGRLRSDHLMRGLHSHICCMWAQQG